MKSFILKFLLLAFVLLVGVVTLFFQQVSTMIPESLFYDSTGQPTLSASDLASIRQVRLLDQSVPIARVSVTNLVVLSQESGTVTVGITVNSSSPETRYPHLRVFLRSGDRVVRTLIFKPTEYEHGTKLTSERVRIPIRVQAGETGFTAQAYYDNSEGEA
ncbi:hypothetical protein [Pandoraea sputorum]